MKVKPYLQNLKNALLNSLAPIIEMLAKEIVILLMNEAWKKDPENAKLIAVELYPLVDAKLEEVVEKTDSDLDDALVDGVMAGLEEFAKDNAFELPNIDED